MDTLNVGTKEVVSFSVADRLETVTDLSIYNCDYKIVTEDETTTIVNWTPVFNRLNMRIDVLIDTTNWSEATYKLYVRVSIPPESPILGPWEFGVS